MTITPLSIWFNGQIRTAKQLNLRVVNDNLTDTALLYYELMELDSNDMIYQVLSQGNINVAGTDYSTWKADADTNEYIKQFAADLLNLTIV